MHRKITTKARSHKEHEGNLAIFIVRGAGAPAWTTPSKIQSTVSGNWRLAIGDFYALWAYAAGYAIVVMSDMFTCVVSRRECWTMTGTSERTRTA